jgi:spore germination cell wall hydrolase CwlJ-like protein
MQLAWFLWLASLMPAQVQDRACLAATVYLEARDQSGLGQLAVAEVVLRRREIGRWGDGVCAVVTKSKQFAPGIVKPTYRFKNLKAWERAWHIAGEALMVWSQPPVLRQLVVPGADHFVALGKAQPDWAQGQPVAVIGDHTFYRLGM